MRMVYLALCVTITSMAFSADEYLPPTGKLPDSTEIKIPYPDVSWKKVKTTYVVIQNGEKTIKDESLLVPTDELLTKIERFNDPSGKKSFFFMFACNKDETPLGFTWNCLNPQTNEDDYFCVLVLENGDVVVFKNPEHFSLGLRKVNDKLCARWVIEVDGKIVAERVFPR